MRAVLGAMIASAPVWVYGVPNAKTTGSEEET
jgi:hypothetical protein